MSKQKRIEWVDVVKGMLVPLIVLGHTSESPQLICLVYSFHMPLFFILSGYTARRPKDLRSYGRHILKSFIRLMLPSIGVLVFIACMEYWRKMGGLVLPVPWHRISGCFYRFYWGCAWGWSGGVPSVGMLWFFITMFWSKLIWEGIGLLFPKGDYALCFLLAVAGILYGPDHFIPQNLDIACAVLVYYSIGELWAKADRELDYQRFKPLLFFAAAAFWMHAMDDWDYVELAVKSYPGFITGILASICASYLFCALGEELSKRETLKKFFSFFGRHTLLIVYIHHCDSLLENIWRKDLWIQSFFIRLLIVISLSLLIILIQELIKRCVGHIKRSKETSTGTA